MAGFSHPSLRVMRGPMADEFADEEDAAGGAVVATRPDSGAGGPGGIAGAVVVAAVARVSPRKEIDRDIMSVHGRRIDDLCRWGWSYKMIGVRVGCNMSALSRMRSIPTYEPHYSLGTSLRRLWMDVAKQRVAMLRDKG